ncbi:prepilin-type N-terminal cleavage/methylation domain-containing protein [Marichromatium sp. AB32]|nr:hypothetical protein [Marichromatium gracile]RNE91364.1 prepilin-type N-terminal cleavage/methylation domain-containing protein [Marichromatium sp. AB32]
MARINPADAQFTTDINAVYNESPDTGTPGRPGCARSSKEPDAQSSAVPPVPRHRPASATDVAAPRTSMTAARRLRGVTLIELMVTLAIAVILLSLAVPGFQHLLQDSRLTGLTNSLSASLQQARVESLSRGQTVAVCATGDADADQPTCTITTDWADGWLVFVRDDADATGVKTDIDGDGRADDRLLKVVRPFGAATLTASGGDPIVFTPPLGEAAETRFTIRVTDGEQRCLRVKRTGQVRLDEGCDG